VSRTTYQSERLGNLSAMFSGRWYLRRLTGKFSRSRHPTGEPELDDVVKIACAIKPVRDGIPFYRCEQ
jgi:hypothetical protein